MRSTVVTVIASAGLMLPGARVLAQSGACVHPDRTCEIVQGAGNCTGPRSAYLGDGSVCPPPCPPGGSYLRCPVEYAYRPSERQVNIASATLFRAFWESQASTNDFIDVDQDGCFGFDPDPQPGDPCFPNQVDQLAPPSIPNCPANYSNAWWIVQNRAVGSVNAFNEFVTFQLCCDIQETRPTEISAINSVRYTDGSIYVNFTACMCRDDHDNDGEPYAGGSPVCPHSIDMAGMDVPSAWAVRALNPAGPRWNLKPTQPGYGHNPRLSIPLPGACPQNDPFDHRLATLTRPCTGRVLNFNTASPDSDTIFDYPMVFVAVVPIANRGVGIDHLRFSEMQHLWISGRLPSGENVAAATRSTGSGTHNAFMNSLGIDPSWGIGDDRAGESTSASQTNLGPCHRVTNCASSSHVENAVQQRRLAIGYTGISGNTAAAVDARAGLYEILDTIKDTAGATQRVRPDVCTIVRNADPNTGYQIGGAFTFATVGDPFATPFPNYPPLPGHEGNPQMCNLHAAAYLRNIRESVAAFVECADCPENVLMPGQYLANTFFLFEGLDARQDTQDPVIFTPQQPNQVLQNYILRTNDLGVGLPPGDRCANPVVPPYGTRNPAGKVPNRGSAYPYRDAQGNLVTPGAGAGQNLATRNRIQGDFLYDGVRDLRDIRFMMKAFQDGSTNYREDGQQGRPPLPPQNEPFGDQVANVIIVDVIGDFDGNGVFDAADVRYFADGLALNPATASEQFPRGTLDRRLGFRAVDRAWREWTGSDDNFFDTQVRRPDGSPAAYVQGASMLDVTGSASGPAPGDAPIGADGIVDCRDLAYLIRNFGDFRNIDDAARRIDLSCDMNGDRVIDCGDVVEFYKAWGLPDLDLSGRVDQPDLGIVLGAFGRSEGQPGYNVRADINNDGIVDQADLGSLLAAWNMPVCNPCNLDPPNCTPQPCPPQP